MPVESTLSFPAKCARGITTEEWVKEEPPYKSAFLFDDLDPNRADGLRELSITWLDDEKAVRTIKKMKFHGESKFPAGLAVIERFKLDLIIETSRVAMSYERQPTKSNRYHGNILVDGHSAVDLRMASTILARSSVHYPITADIPLC